jgi:sugar phosphate isomerase/epimerase
MYLRAISTLGCGSLALDEACALALRHGLDAVELRALGGTLDLPTWLESRYEDSTGFARSVDCGGVGIVSLDTSFKLVGATSDERTALLKFIPWAEAMGVKYLRVFDGGRRHYDSDELAEAVANFTWWRKLRADQGWAVDLMVETHDSLLTSSDISRFVSAASEIPVLWDSHHTWRKGGEDPLRTWAAIGRHVVHVHVKDSQAGTYVLPGAGEFPMAPLRALLAKEFTGAVSLEWEKWWHPQLPDLDVALTTAGHAHWW